MDPFTGKSEGILRQLREIREKHGDAAYKTACKELAQQVLHIPHGDEVHKRLIPDIDLSEKIPPKPPRGPAMPSFDEPDQLALLHLLKAKVPNLQSEGQVKVLMGCVNALLLTLDGYFGDKPTEAGVAREGLNKLLDLSKQITDVNVKLGEVPDEVRSETARQFYRDFHEPAKGLTEEDEAKAILSELASLGSVEEVQQWYADNRNRLEQIVSPGLRNDVFDTIRVKARKV